MPKEVRRKLLVAVDYGTTFTSVAWCLTTKPEIQSIIVQWPNEFGSMHGFTSEAVPTELRYNPDGSGYKWGFEIKESELRIQRFKLGLNSDGKLQLSYLSHTYPDAMALPQDEGHKPTELTKDFLTKLYIHITHVLKSKLGSAVVSTTPMEFILTVPAIWEEKGKDDTRTCGKDAGFGDPIHMISEPEAAATYALQTMDPGTLAVNDTFVVCDAGGGTCDLISYKIKSLGKSFKLREATAGTGDLCGSSFLNSIFRNFLIKRFEDEEECDEDTLEDAMQRFESITKREFHGEDADFVIPVPGIPDNPLKSVRRGKLRLTLAEMLSIFEPVVLQVTVLVVNQIKATKGNVKAVLLVGGFGQSPFLKKMVQKVVGPDVEVLQPPNGWTAVVRGALIRGLALTSIDTPRVSVSSRVARKCYGTLAGTKFNFKKHDRARRYYSAFEGEYQIEEVSWLVKKGDTLEESAPIAAKFYRTRRSSDGRFPIVQEQIMIYDGSDAEDPPVNPTAEGCSKQITWTVDLSKIPMTRLKTVIGADGKKYFRLDYAIRVAFYSAHTEYSLWFDGTCYGKVEAKYD